MKKIAMLLMPVVALLLGAPLGSEIRRNAHRDPGVDRLYLAEVSEIVRPTLEQGVPSLPDDVYAQKMETGWEYLQAGNLDAAADSYSAAARMQSGAVDPRMGMLAVALAGGGAPEVMIAAEEILSKSPDNYQAMLAVAKASVCLGDYSKANRVFRRILELHPRDPRALKGAAQIASVSGERATSPLFLGQLASAGSR